MQNIVLVSNTSSYFNVTIGNKLKEEYEIIEVKAEPDDLSEVPTDVSAWLIFLDEEMLDARQNFIFMKNKALDDEVPVFFIGGAEEIVAAKNQFIGCQIQGGFAHPIDVNAIVKTVKEYIKTNEKHIKKKILVVDDSGAVLRNVKGWLEGKYQVALANSGAMAIKYITLNRPDLVLLEDRKSVV